MKRSHLFIVIIFVFFQIIKADFGKFGSREKRVALVIGNAEYKRSPLKNTVNDAIDISDALKSRGFEVITRTNTNYRVMWNAIREFGRKLINSDVGLFYYSGHGVQVDGINYLIPVNSGIISEDETRFKAVDASLVLQKMKSAGNAMNIVVLDACRINPYEKVRGGTGGLARMDAPSGSIIIYSTSPGKTASDGRGRNGIFTKHFLRAILGDDIEIGMLLRKVRRNTIKETGGRQVPWESSSLTGEFYFSKEFTEGKYKPLKDNISGSRNYEFSKMTFFESGKELDEISNRVYTDTFVKQKSRYINTKLVFRNKLYNLKDSVLNIELKFFKPDGSYWNTISKRIKVSKDLDLAAYERLGFGWSSSGNWIPGKYKVQVFFDGTYMAQSEFKILSDISTSSRSGHEYKNMRFFESGNDYKGEKKVVYASRFPKLYTRSIYIYILFENKFYKLRDQKIKIRVIINKPDGTPWGNIERNISVSKELDLASYDKSGWGWERAGNWERGKYKVKIYMDERKVDESEFEIY